MFGKKQSGRDGEIDLAGFDLLDGSFEFARLWAEPQGPMTCIIEPRALGADPFLFVIAMVDAIGHGAKAYAHALGIPEEEAHARIWEGLDAERASPTDEAHEIDPDGSLQ